MVIGNWRKGLSRRPPGNAPTSAVPILFPRQVQPGASARATYLPAFQKLAARVGLAPTPRGLTGRRATLTLPGNGAAGRILTRIVPFRRRMPDIFDHDSKLKLVSAAGVAPGACARPPPSVQAECVAATLRAEYSGRLFETSEWRNAKPKPWESASR